MTIREKILYCFEQYPKTKENDNLLIAYIIRDVYGIQNTFDIALYVKTNIYETIRRERAKLQQEDESLRPSEQCQKARREKEDRLHEYYRSNNA